MARCLAQVAQRCRRCLPIPSPRPTSAEPPAGLRLGRSVGGYWLGLSQPLALAACGAAGALGTLVLLVSPGRPARRHGNAASGRTRHLSGRRSRYQPCFGARPFPVRLLRRVRLVDGQLHRPQPVASRGGAHTGSHCNRPADPPVEGARSYCLGRGCCRVDRAPASTAVHWKSLP